MGKMIFATMLMVESSMKFQSPGRLAGDSFVGRFERSEDGEAMDTNSHESEASNHGRHGRKKFSHIESAMKVREIDFTGRAVVELKMMDVAPHMANLRDLIHVPHLPLKVGCGCLSRACRG